MATGLAEEAGGSGLGGRGGRQSESPIYAGRVRVGSGAAPAGHRAPRRRRRGVCERARERERGRAREGEREREREMGGREGGRERIVYAISGRTHGEPVERPLSLLPRSPPLLLLLLASLSPLFKQESRSCARACVRSCVRACVRACVRVRVCVCVCACLGAAGAVVAGAEPRGAAEGHHAGEDTREDGPGPLSESHTKSRALIRVTR